MIIPFPIEPTAYTLRFVDGLWRLTLTREDRTSRKVASWFTLADAIEGAKRIASDRPNGATLTILTVVQFRERKQVLQFAAAERREPAPLTVV